MGEEGEDDWPLDGDESGDEYSDESDIFGEASSSSSQSEESSDGWGNNDDLAGSEPHLFTLNVDTRNNCSR